MSKVSQAHKLGIKYPKSVQPKSGRLIRVYGFDWSEYQAIGKFVLYKNKRKGRFMMEDRDTKGFWYPDKAAWWCGKSWEYLEDPTVEGAQSSEAK